MGTRNQKLSTAACFLPHPRCYFCEGRRPAVERDRAPARMVFRGKHVPDPFEFPACVEHNRTVAPSEQITAFYVRSIHQSYDMLDEEAYQKLIDSIVNNARDALPYKDRSRPPLPYTRYIAPDAEECTISIPKIAKAHLDLFGTKMLTPCIIALQAHQHPRRCGGRSIGRRPARLR